MKRIRDQIIETAGALFQEKGYTGVGINEIIEKSGVSKAGFYQNFESKENLCVQWLMEVHRQSELRHSTFLESDLTGPELVKTHFSNLSDTMACRNFRGCPFSNTASVIDASIGRIRTEIESHKIYLREFFVDLARKCGFESEAEVIGDHLFLLYSGAATEAQNLRSDWPIRRACELATRLVSTRPVDAEAENELRRKRELLSV
tara:strand:+ start:28766 stop:29377 length:612 start_codon:yes stop_codon:yes gene_type:complete